MLAQLHANSTENIVSILSFVLLVEPKEMESSCVSDNAVSLSDYRLKVLFLLTKHKYLLAASQCCFVYLSVILTQHQVWLSNSFTKILLTC